MDRRGFFASLTCLLTRAVCGPMPRRGVYVHGSESNAYVTWRGASGAMVVTFSSVDRMKVAKWAKYRPVDRT